MTDRDPSRVHWMELFFDLIFVALVGQLAHGLHSAPTFSTLLLFVALFATVWWSWVNLTFAVDVMPQLSRRALALAMLVSMFGVGAIAVAAPEATTDRAGLFAAGNAVLRLVLLVLWVRQQWSNALGSRLRVSAYNGLTAALWLASIAVPHPFDFALWSLAIVLEVVLLISSSSRWASGLLGRLNVDHLSERFGLLVIIVLGESVVAIVAALNAALTAAAAITAALALVTVSLLAWSFFLYGADVMRDGLARLRDEGNDRAIRDTVAFLPFLLVSGVAAISGALAIAIAHPAMTLPAASALSLGGGIALFYVTNGIISRRFGAPWRDVLRWAVPAVGLSIILVVVALVATAQIAVILAVLILGYAVGSAEFTSRRRALAAR